MIDTTKVTTKIADLLPMRIRQIAYTALATLAALEVIWDIIDDGVEGRIWATLTVLGFGLAASQTRQPQPGE